MTGPRIAIVLKGYPRLSETFIAQELLALEARGLVLEIWSLRRPTDTARHPMHATIRAPVAYMPEYLRRAPLRVLRALVWATRQPRFGRLLALFARDLRRDPTASRLRRLGQALVLARDLPKAVTHLHAHFLHTPASVARYAATLTGRRWSFSAHAKDIWTTPDWELCEKLADAAWGVTCTRDGFLRLKDLAESGVGLPPPSAGEGGPRVSEGRERGAPYPAASLPSPDPLRGPPSPAEGGGKGAVPEPDSITLAYHGLDLARFPPPPAHRPPRDGSDPDDPLQILCVGRLVAKKGHDDLIAALIALPAALHWRLVLIGGGELRGGLKARVRERGLSQRVAFRGAQAQPAVIAAMRAADLFVLPAKTAPSGDRDGLPNVLMEAASQGLPILATDFAGTPEFITHGIHGFLVRPGDPAALSAAIDDLARDPAGRRHMAEAARTRLARDFSADAGIDLIEARLRTSAGLAPVAARSVPQTREPCACAS